MYFVIVQNKQNIYFLIAIRANLSTETQRVKICKHRGDFRPGLYMKLQKRATFFFTLYFYH